MLTQCLALYLVTDRDLCPGRSTREIVAAAVAGGVTCVQIREKNSTTRAFLEEAGSVHHILRNTGVPLIINDRVDVALAVGADGVHLGQSDMPLFEARKLLGQDAIIGISAENLDDALQAEEHGADYIAISPVFRTLTKTNTALPLGLDGIALLRAHVSIPVVGIGGIDAHNAPQVLRAGCHGVAVVSAIVAAADPQQAAAELKHIITRTLEESCTNPPTPAF
ncbi:MAG: thiamine phosphate synthase [Desulfovibrionales bacterium]|nr:thiamine phosphate synthase [Desulfovibrionales bacterium]